MPRPAEEARLKANQLHSWDLAPRDAAALQEQLRSRVVIEPLRRPATVAGVDVGFPRGLGVARAAVTVLELPGLRLIEQAEFAAPVDFPYVPGLLSFREVPVVLPALEQLNVPPDVLLVDGHGYAHPRRFGLACHLGVLLDRPTIGCAKSLLLGAGEPPAQAAGSRSWLIADGEVVGAALRTQTGIKPVYVSIGHRVDLDSALELVLACTARYRLPEPIRLAHRLASRRGAADHRPRRPSRRTRAAG